MCLGTRMPGCKPRLLFAKIAMPIWFQVSGVSLQVSDVSLQVSVYRVQVSGVRRHAALRKRFISYAIINIQYPETPIQYLYF